MHYHLSSNGEVLEDEGFRRCFTDPEEAVTELLSSLVVQATYCRESCESGCTTGGLCDWCEAGAQADEARSRVDVKKAVRALKKGTDLVWVLYGPGERETLRVSVEQ
ncbi:hypothetical protein ACFC1D_05115 [Streptomyces vinaceus]|uniref:hypothetical protein n=1 Tax=Streptomyces vinaceus TaxID=1960 RepID=UPI0035DB6B8C